MAVTPVKVLSDVPTEDGRAVATVAVQGYEAYPTAVTYWPELKNDPTAASKPGWGPMLAAKFIAKEAAVAAPGLVAAGLKKRQDTFAALPPAPTDGSADPSASERVLLQQQITDLTNLQAIVNADAVPRIDDFYNSLIATLPANDPRIALYQREQADTKAAVGGGPALPATI